MDVSPRLDGVEHESERVVQRCLSILWVGAESPVAERTKNRSQHEVHERIARDIAPDLAARLRQLNEGLNQLLRRAHRESLPARAHFEDGTTSHLASPCLPAHDLVEQRVQSVAEARTAKQIG